MAVTRRLGCGSLRSNIDKTPIIQSWLSRDYGFLAHDLQCTICGSILLVLTTMPCNGVAGMVDSLLV